MSGPAQVLARPAAGEFAEYYAGYIARVPGDDILGVLAAQVHELSVLSATVPAAREQYRYAAGKWSVREVIGHLVDGERVFGYRAFHISRGDATPLAGFDENAFVAASGYDARPLTELVREFALVREANLACLQALDEGQGRRIGTANGLPVSVRALAWIMAGHVNHHLGQLREHYGVGAAP
jgi:hypothetical protein